MSTTDENTADISIIFDEKSWEEKSPQELFNDIAESIGKYSKSEMSSEDSKRAARLLIEYIRIVLQYYQAKKKKEREVQSRKKPQTVPPMEVPVKVPVELLAQQQSNK